MVGRSNAVCRYFLGLGILGSGSLQQSAIPIVLVVDGRHQWLRLRVVNWHSSSGDQRTFKTGLMLFNGEEREWANVIATYNGTPGE